MRGDRVSAYVWTWLGLLALLAASCASSFVPLGRLNAFVNVGIALAKALLVALVFMHLRRDRPIVRLVAVAGLAWLALLFGLSLADFLTRGP
ncbi:MAG TPA: cytochrome C oxidase subunit IV family protein [Casimicrobiaceae bacterium]|nr:cytochrome C oxidase subunit IV family protein [Casimicrobiaceae bacterium]